MSLRNEGEIKAFQDEGTSWFPTHLPVQNAWKKGFVQDDGVEAGSISLPLWDPELRHLENSYPWGERAATRQQDVKREWKENTSQLWLIVPLPNPVDSNVILPGKILTHANTPGLRTLLWTLLFFSYLSLLLFPFPSLLFFLLLLRDFIYFLIL